jgi:tetratricopeptide (TPR) repeat protein
MRAVLLAGSGVFLGWLLAAGAAAHGQGAEEPTLQRAAALIEEGDAAAALELLDPYLRRRDKSAPGFLLRSTARFIEGDREGGAADLERAVRLDPDLRQAWLNLGALRLSDADHAGALEAFERARDLDPSAPDNGLNLGTALLLMGRVEEASELFRGYLRGGAQPGPAALVVAKNYALAGYQALAIESLRAAIVADEKLRLQARIDPAFDPLRASAPFRELLELDLHQLAPGAYMERQLFDVAYEPNGRALGAVLDALRALGIAYDVRVEVTPSWSLVWSEMRIEVAAAGDGTAVEISAPPEAFTPAAWQRRSRELFDRIRWELAPKLPPIPGRNP